MTPTSPPPTAEEMVGKLKGPVSAFLVEHVKKSITKERSEILATIRRLHYYFQGQQYLVGFQTLDGTRTYLPAGETQQVLGQVNTFDDVYDYVMNFLRGDTLALVSALSARAPNTQAMPIDANNPLHVIRARQANRVGAFLDRHWQVNNVMQDLAYLLCIHGPVFGYTRYVTNRQRYGQRPDPTSQISSEVQTPFGESFYQCPSCGAESTNTEALAAGGGTLPVCPSCFAPLDPASVQQPPTIPSTISQSSQMVDNGAIELDLCSFAQVTIPLQYSWEKTPFLVYEYYENKGALIRTYAANNPELRNRILHFGSGQTMGGTGDSGTRQTQAVLASSYPLNTTTESSQALFTRIWLDPSQYELFGTGTNLEIRDLLISAYPEGAKLTLINDELVAIDEGRLHREWAYCRPTPSSSPWTMPYMEVYVQAQDLINDSVALIVEQAENSMSGLAFDPSLLDRDMLSKTRMRPSTWLPIKVGMATDLNKSFFRIPGSDMNPALIEFITLMLQWTRDISGITPVMWGGESSSTAKEAEIRRNQALGRLNVLWNNMRQFLAKLKDNAVWQAGRYAKGSLFTTKGTTEESEVLEMATMTDLAKGGYRFFAEEGFPMTPGQRRDWFMQFFMEAPPEARVQMAIDHPANLSRLQEAIGSADWVNPKLDMRDAIMKVIQQLASTEPVTDPVTLELIGPTVEPDPILFDPPFAYEVVRAWMISEEGQQISDSNPGGFANVRLYLMKWFEILNPPMMPDSDGEEGPPPPGGSGGPSGPSGPGDPGGSGPSGPPPPSQEPGGMASPPPASSSPPPAESPNG